MVDKCVNPACSETFRRLSAGRVFVIEVQADYQTGQGVRQRQYFGSAILAARPWP